jgi:hypothetical protein
MATPPSTPKLYKLLLETEALLSAAAQAPNPEKQLATATLAQATATLALAHATWLAPQQRH